MPHMTIGVVGLGQFAPEFIELFQAHPDVARVALCDVVPERRDRVSRDFGITETYADFDELLASDVDAIAIFTQRWLHGPMAIAALKRGKHVYSAVPMGVSVDEIHEILDLVKSTGLTYMTGETSYYYPAVIYCRQKWREGAFGRFVFGEGEYLHDMSQGFYKAFQFSGGSDWKRTASFPPMFYPTHSISAVLSVTDSYATSVSCIGYVDQENDGVFDKTVSLWHNDFSNETALFSTADGGSLRINEMRRVGSPHLSNREVALSLFGTHASFEQQPGSSVFGTLESFTDVTELLRTAPMTASVGSRDFSRTGVDASLEASFRSGFADVHAIERLPAEFAGLHNGHEGSHQFLVHDFVTAVTTGSLVPLNAWAAARFTVPGLIAHQSALQGGERLQIPDFGPAPDAR